MHEQLIKRICDQSEGNPGALTVLTVGVQRYGEDFLDKVADAHLIKSQIWQAYKDLYEYQIDKMYEAMKSGVVFVRAHNGTLVEKKPQK